ncbi:RNA polymerase sigma factor [Kordiimonas aquimaris]|uniref:RNA polymerase sigma factor n=1 Tax=Kordiimonas aquimaris TaxID=707591 RepID=UPI0021D1FF75|nr:sigma-70 family RNA polymerase sigma factor [Kordiimonas aquimaris]
MTEHDNIKDANNSTIAGESGADGVNAAAPQAAPSKVIAHELVGAQLERMARTQRRRLVADLVTKLGVKRLEMAEDVVQDAVIAAMQSWPFKGMPDSPAAWLNRVARNKAYDRLRREGREQSITNDDESEHDPRQHDDAVMSQVADHMHGQFYGAQVNDPELKLIFLCCHDSLVEEDRLMLTLKVVSGFTARDIAAVFLKKEAAVGQRLARAKRKLRALDGEGTSHDLNDLSRFAVQARLNTVLKVIYLMFALGYAPRRGEALIQQDVALEALRLAEVLAGARETVQPAVHALAALLNLQASRFAARTGPDTANNDMSGRLVLLRDQNRALWDTELIKRGMVHLAMAQAGDALSRYHLEAGIAAAHATAKHFGETDWTGICALYVRLEAMTNSPVVAVNACVAQAFAGTPEKAFLKLEALAGAERLSDYAPYHIARGELLRMLSRPIDAAESFQAAIVCAASAPVIAHLQDRLASCV